MIGTTVGDHGTSRTVTAGSATASPGEDVIDTNDDIVIKTELPGIDEKDVNVEINGGVLTIKGERKLETAMGEKGARRIARLYGSFLHSFTPPTWITASVADRLLEVHMPTKAGDATQLPF